MTQPPNPKLAYVCCPSLAMRKSPSREAGLETEALFGEAVEVLYREKDEATGEAWGEVKLATDGYVAWVEMAGLVLNPPAGLRGTHWVVARRTVITATADFKSRCLGYIPLGGRVAVEGEEGRLARIALPAGDSDSDSDGKGGHGYIPLAHILPDGAVVEDWVATAESLLGVPYKWGGRDSLGLDCSALVQLALASGGVASPRNSGDQAKQLGEGIAGDLPELARGDLVFWAGHVGVMVDSRRLIHANAWHGMVAIEELAVAKKRIAEETGGDITRFARIVG